MKIKYDPEADALYIKIQDGEVDHTQEIDENTMIDLDKAKQVIGIEILFVKERNPKLLKELQVEKVIN